MNAASYFLKGEKHCGASDTPWNATFSPTRLNLGRTLSTRVSKSNYFEKKNKPINKPMPIFLLGGYTKINLYQMVWQLSCSGSAQTNPHSQPNCKLGGAYDMNPHQFNIINVFKPIEIEIGSKNHLSWAVADLVPSVQEVQLSFCPTPTPPRTHRMTWNKVK